ncbi:DUF4240 domain-containing protein [Nonomuraea dietziae]|uniref:DUF4240 domain-containing protein n=1 Tax=Nonomuraea dietziae TaxID=65515 RepID=UPI0033EAF53C
MDIDGFWDLIERSERETDTKRERVAWLEEHLFGLSVEEIVDFDVFWTIATNRACSWDMYALYRHMLSSYSSDGFEYFVNWLVGLGREAFETIADCPDRAVEVPQVRRVLELQRSAFNGSRRRREVWTEEEYPEFESLGYVTREPYEKAAGENAISLGQAVVARGVEGKFPWFSFHAEPDGEGWDFEDKAEMVRRLPRTARWYGMA